MSIGLRSLLRLMALVSGLCAGGRVSVSACVATVQPTADPAYQSVAYKERPGGYCEGLYQQPVSASAQLKIIGAHLGHPSFKPQSNAPISIEVPGSTDPGLVVRLLSNRSRAKYRLDARLTTNRFSWPRTIIADRRVALTASDVAALVCDGTCEAGELTIYPALVSDTPGAERSDGVIVIFRAASELKQLLISVEKSGKPVEGWANKNVLDQDLPGGVAKLVFIPLLPGKYSLKGSAIPVGAVAPDQTKATLWIKK